MQSVPLDKKRHDRNYFDCGTEILNNYLRLMANQQSSVFYEKFGFTPFKHEKNKLFISVADVRASFGK